MALEERCWSWKTCTGWFSMHYQCYTKVKPIEIPTEYKWLVQTACPKLALSNYTCCNKDRLKELYKYDNLLRNKYYLALCPQCLYNVMNFLCDIVCSTEGDKYRALASSKWQTQRENYDIIVAWRYLRDTYQSCKDIRLPHNNMLLMDFMCGQYNHYSCTPMRMFYNLPEWENVTHIRSFYRYIFNATKDKVHVPYEENSYTCNKKFQPIQNMPAYGPCKCRDCSDSCPQPGYLRTAAALHPYIEEFGIEDPKTYQIYLYVAFALATVFFIIGFMSIYFCRGQDVSIDTFNKKEAGALRKFKLMEPNPNVQELADMDQFDDQFGVCFRPLILRVGAKISYLLEVFFDWWGRFWGHFPGVALFIGLSLVVILSHGVPHLHVSMDPDEYMVATSTRSQLENDFFETHFEPYVRINTIIVHVKKIRYFEYRKSVLARDPRKVYFIGPAFNDTILLKIKNLTEMVKEIVPTGERKAKYRDFCFDPYAASEFAGPTKNNWRNRCLVHSAWAWYQNNETLFREMRKNKSYIDRIVRCTDYPDHIDCMPEFGRAVPPALVLGGFLTSKQTLPRKPNYLRANTHIIQFIFNNINDPLYQKKVYEWEKEFTTFMNEWIEQYQPPYLDVAFTAHSAHTQEAEDSPMKSELIQDAYFLKFLFCALCWSTFSKISRLVVDTRFMVAAGAVGIVYSSATAALGLMGFVDGMCTVVIERMLPVLMLAIGANNLHYLADHHWREKMKPDETVSKHLGRVLAQVGGAMLLTSILETVVLFVNRQNAVPSIWWFAVFGTTASVINLAVVMTFGIGMFAIDRHRYLKQRFDILICITAKSQPQSLGSEGILFKFFKYGYAPFLMNAFVRCIVMVLFGWWFCISLIVIPELKLVPTNKYVGLPKNSHLKKYYDFHDRYVHLGPELYFVVTEGFNVTNPSLQEIVGMQRWSTPNSMANMLYKAHLDREKTTIALPPTSWYDDFMDWLRVEECCQVFKNGSFCPNDYRDEKGQHICLPCNITHYYRMYGTHDPRIYYKRDFKKYLSFFVRDHSSPHCIKGGLAEHAGSLNIFFVKENRATIKSFYFKTYFNSLHSNDDMRIAMKEARIVAANITSMISREVRKRQADYQHLYGPPPVMFAISPFFSKFEQVNRIWLDLLKNVGWSCLFIFIVTLVLLGLDVFTALAQAIFQFMCVINTMAFLYWNKFPINAYTCIFLTVSQAMFVAFASFISHSYSMSAGSSRVLRAADAVINAGPTVTTGVALGKLPAVLLYFTNYVVMYRTVGVQIYLYTILVGTLHGLIFFPVLLSFIGSARNRQKVINHLRRKCDEEECPYTEYDRKSKLHLEPLDEEKRKPMPAIVGHGDVDMYCEVFWRTFLTIQVEIRS